jgi:hypothetical protein
MSAFKKKLSTSYLDNRKDALRASQEFARPHTPQVPVYKIVNSFERLFLEKTELLGHPAHTGLPKEIFLEVQLPRHSEATAAVV